MLRDSKIVRKYLAWALDTAKASHVRVLREVPLFKGMGENLLRKLLVDLVEKEYRPGDIIFHEGDRGKALYVVLDGAVKISKRSCDGDKTLAVLGPGAHFGELALINQCSRFATAVAERECLTLIMYKSYFDDLIRGNSAISSKILLNLAEILSAYIYSNQFEPSDKQNSA